MVAVREYPHPGIETWKNSNGTRIIRLHYSADPDKTPEWAEQARREMSDPAMFRQELEIDFSAKLGSLLFQLDDEATLCDSFPIPPSWTRRMVLDPHPRVPHCFLWGATDPYGDRWYYRELWPSKIYGRPGNIPEDDNRHTIKQYVETVKWLESRENEENNGADEYIYSRIIDYAARGMGKGTTDDPEQPNFQQRYEKAGDELGIDMRFEDAKKDREVGVELVNQGLKPLEVEINGKWVKKSRIHIFRDRCPELIWQLKNNRYAQLTAVMAESHDPLSKAVQKRNHATDDLRYLEMSNPIYISREQRISSYPASQGGIAL